MTTQLGLTLIELMVAITIAGILMAVGLPAFADYIANSRLREGGNAVLVEALFAQNEAIKRNGLVRLSLNGQSVQVLDASITPQVVLRERVLPDSISAGTASVSFSSAGRPDPFGTVPALIQLTKSGSTCSEELRCPALRIEAGGAVRLCGDASDCP